MAQLQKAYQPAQVDECCNLDTMDKENLDSIAGALVDALSVLRRQTITPSAVCGCGFSNDRQGKPKKNREDCLSKFHVEESEKGC